MVARGFTRPGRYHAGPQRMGFEAAGTRIDDVPRMDTDTPTVDSSLAALSDAVGKASVDLLAVKTALDKARADIASRNTSIAREVIRHAEHAIDHLRGADESLRHVLKDLVERD